MEVDTTDRTLTLTFKKRWSSPQENAFECFLRLILSSNPNPKPRLSVLPMKLTIKVSGIHDSIERVYRALAFLREYVIADTECERGPTWEIAQLAQFFKPSVATEEDDEETRLQRFQATVEWATEYFPHQKLDADHGGLRIFLGSLLLNLIDDTEEKKAMEFA